MEYTISLPFGTGEAILTIDFTAGEKEYFNHKEGWGNPESADEVEIVTFEVGGVDILEELDVNISEGKYISNWVDNFLDKNYDKILEQIHEQQDEHNNDY
jgi:hypothetical protein